MQAIVLKRTNFREFDQLISLYTKEKGRQEVLARGVKKMVSKNTSHLELFSLVHVDIVPGKQIDHLIKVQPIQYFSSIRNDITKSLVAARMVKLVDLLTKVDSHDVRVFELLYSWLVFIEKQASITHTLCDAFVLQFCVLLGFEPQCDACVVCGVQSQDILRETIEQGTRAGWYCAGGGLLCSSCTQKKRAIGEHVLDCGIKEVSDIQACVQHTWQSVHSFELNDEERGKLHTLVYEFLMYHTEYDVIDWKNGIDFA